MSERVRLFQCAIWGFVQSIQRNPVHLLQDEIIVSVANAYLGDAYEVGLKVPLLLFLVVNARRIPTEGLRYLIARRDERDAHIISVLSSIKLSDLCSYFPK